MRDELESVLYEFAETWFDAVRDKDTKTGIEAVETALTSIINLVDKELPEHKHIKVPYGLVELQKAYENGYNQAVDDMRAKLKGVSNG